jgi:hypothetical protein
MKIILLDIDGVLNCDKTPNSRKVMTLEMSALPVMSIHGLMGTLRDARLLDPFGMYAKPGSLVFRIGSVWGMTITMIVMITCAVLILWRAVPR